MLILDSNVNSNGVENYSIKRKDDKCLFRFINVHNNIIRPAIDAFLIFITGTIVYINNNIYTVINETNSETTTESIIIFTIIYSLTFLDMLKHFEYMMDECYHKNFFDVCYDESFPDLYRTDKTEDFNNRFRRGLIRWLWSIPLSGFQMYGFNLSYDPTWPYLSSCILVFAIYGSIKLLPFIIVGSIYLFKFVYLKIVICKKKTNALEIEKIKNENKKIKDELNKLKREHVVIPIDSKTNNSAIL